MMKIECVDYPQFISVALYNAIHQHIEHAIQQEVLSHQSLSTAKRLVLIFQDSGYSAEQGGYHPIELLLKRPSAQSDTWQLAYITSRSYQGKDNAQLKRELDFDFQSGKCLLSMLSGWQFIDGSDDALELYRLWESNFLAYLYWGAYDRIQMRAFV
ncbi:MAG: DUF2787 family protein [Vibrio hibernica]